MPLENITPDLRPTSWSAVLGRMIFCLVLALGLYGIIVGTLLTPYINKGSDAGRVVGVYEAYNRIRASAQRGRELVLFWGSSMVREGVDCNLLESTPPHLAAYNLSISGDIPYRRIVELPRVKELHPDRVVIGVSYEVFEVRTPFEDQIGALPARAYSEMPTEARALMTPRFREIADRPAWERFWWKRKFLFSAVCWKLGLPDRTNPLPDGHVNNFKAPFVLTKNIRPAELERFLAQRHGYYPPYTSGGETNVGEGLSSRSLALLIHELKKQETLVVLVNMPLHPLLNAAVPVARRAALREYLKAFASVGVTVVDCQDKFGAECFIDLVHLNATGRAAFTGLMAGHLGATPSAELTTVQR